MKLTTQQVTFIDETLILNGLKFEDLKLEVTDHIASEIEFLMGQNTLSFEENLSLVLENWKTQLKPSLSLWINNSKATPKMVTKKCNRIIIRIMVLSLMISLLAALIIMLITKQLQNDELNIFVTYLFRISGVSLLIAFIYTRYKIGKSKYISTYGYLFNKNGFVQIINLIFIAIGFFPIKISSTISSAHFLQTFFPILLLCISFFYLETARKHLQFNRKIALI